MSDDKRTITIDTDNLYLATDIPALTRDNVVVHQWTMFGYGEEQFEIALDGFSLDGLTRKELKILKRAIKDALKRE